MDLIRKVTVERIIDGFLFTYADGKKAVEKTDAQIISRLKSLHRY